MKKIILLCTLFIINIALAQEAYDQHYTYISLDEVYLINIENGNIEKNYSFDSDVNRTYNLAGFLFVETKNEQLHRITLATDEVRMMKLKQSKSAVNSFIVSTKTDKDEFLIVSDEYLAIDGEFVHNKKVYLVDGRNFTYKDSINPKEYGIEGSPIYYDGKIIRFFSAAGKSEFDIQTKINLQLKEEPIKEDKCMNCWPLTKYKSSTHSYNLGYSHLAISAPTEGWDISGKEEKDKSVTLKIKGEGINCTINVPNPTDGFGISITDLPYCILTVSSGPTPHIAKYNMEKGEYVYKLDLDF